MSSSNASTETTATASASFASFITPVALPGRRGAGLYRIVTVCIGNICRSTIAEVVLRDRFVAADIPDSGSGGVTATSADISNEEHGDPVNPQTHCVLTEAGYSVGVDDVSCAMGSAIASHATHRVTDAKITEADLLLAATDFHWNILQHHAAGLGAEPGRIHMYRRLDPALVPQAEAVTAGGLSHSALNVPDPWYGTVANFLDILEVVERVGNELAEQLAVLRG